MAVVGARVTVGVTAVAVADAASDTTDVSGIVSGQKNGYAANIRNRGTVAIYLGDSGVTTGTGFQLTRRVDQPVGVPRRRRVRDLGYGWSAGGCVEGRGMSSMGIGLTS
jgi:hypothetical protein